MTKYNSHFLFHKFTYRRVNMFLNKYAFEIFYAYKFLIYINSRNFNFITSEKDDF